MSQNTTSTGSSPSSFSASAALPARAHRRRPAGPRRSRKASSSRAGASSSTTSAAAAPRRRRDGIGDVHSSQATTGRPAATRDHGVGRARRSACTPGANFGTRNVTLRPGARARSRRPARSRRRTPAAAARRRCRARPSRPASDRLERRPDDIRVGARAVVLDGDQRVGAVVGGGDRDGAPTSASAVEAVPHRVLDERLHDEERHRDRQHLGRDPQRDPQPVAEAGLLEHEVALGVAQLVGQRGELAAAAQRVPGEVGELEQQLARPVGIGPGERRDRGERVVDEVRADLGAQRPQLGLGQHPALRVGAGRVRAARTPSRRPPRPRARASPCSRASRRPARRPRRRRRRPGWRRRSARGSPAAPQHDLARPRSTVVRPPSSTARACSTARAGVVVRVRSPSTASVRERSVSATADGAEQRAQMPHRPLAPCLGQPRRAGPARPGSRCAACRRCARSAEVPRSRRR